MPTLKEAARRVALAALVICAFATTAHADAREKVRIPVGRSEVVVSNDEVRTVAIAEPKIADAAVGSQRTIVVSGKSVGITTLVVYEEGGKFTVYDIDVYVPNQDKQVALHVRVAEVTEQAKRELGWDFASNGITKSGVKLGSELLTGKVTPLPLPPLFIGPTTDGHFQFTNKGGDLHFETAWRALEEKGAIRVLANPTLLANSGDTASFLAGGEIPIPIASASGFGGTTITIEWKEYGIRVAFRPYVQEDGSILLNVAPEVSQLDFNNALKLSDAVIPALLTRKTKTTVMIRPGENLVISGLKQTESTKNIKKVPLLGDIPLLGFFLTSSHIEKTDRELMVVVSPEIQESGSTTMPKLPTDRPEK
jgi:pilus assembly protein CpaC